MNKLTSSIKKALSWLFAVFIALLFQHCTKYFEEWQELPNSRIVQQTVASTIDFYDNYDNDSILSNKVATLSFPEKTFNKNSVIISMHLYSNVYLNTEFANFGYVKQSFLGKDSTNRFVYFLAKEQNGDFILESDKEVEIELRFNCLEENEMYRYRLYRINMPTDAKIASNSLNEALAYYNYDLYYNLSGRLMGGACLFSYDIVDDALITADKANSKKLTAKFKTNQFNSVYCLVRFIAPFKVIRDATLITPGLAIPAVDSIVYDMPVKTVKKLLMLSTVDYPYKQFLYIEREWNVGEYEFLIDYTVDSELDITMVEKACKHIGSYELSAVSYDSNSEQFKFTDVLGNWVILSLVGDLIKKQFYLEDDILDKLSTDFGWYDSKPGLVETITIDGNPFYSVAMSDDAKLLLKEDYTYYKLTNRNLLKNSTFINKLWSNEPMSRTGNAKITAIVPFVESDASINYYVALDNKAEMIVNSQGEFLHMFNIQLPITEIPISITNDLITRFGGSKPIQQYCFKTISIDGTLIYKIELENSKIAAYKYNTGNFEFFYEQNNYLDFPQAVKDAIAADESSKLLGVQDLSIYTIDSRYIIAVNFIQNFNKSSDALNRLTEKSGLSNITSVLFDKETGTIIGRIKPIKESDLIEPIKTYLAKNLGSEVITDIIWTKIDAAQPHEFYRIIMESKREYIFTSTGLPVNWE